jgi:hypothetical protein
MNPLRDGLLRLSIVGGLLCLLSSVETALGETFNAQAHWSYRPIRRPAVPQVRERNWVRNPIDAFVLARLEKANIDPAPAADRPTLLRRLSLDLIGLPPTPAEHDAFLDDTRPDAYERVVKRMLSSAYFGERWARHWLDLARYADSDGYEDDKHRPDAWRYRDWVVDAMNRDLPFDAFTIQQVAGDLLPDATYEQKLATGFHRMTLSNNAGGADTEEYRVKTVKDRVNTVGTTWLGLTLGCAACHDHKYDPIAQRDYYTMYAFFNTADEVDIPAPAPPDYAVRMYERTKQAFDDKKARLQAALDHYEKNILPNKQIAWEQNAPRASLPEPVAAIVMIPRDLRHDEQRTELASYYRSIDPRLAELQRDAGFADPNNVPPPPSTKALTLAESDTVRTAHIQLRGDFLSPGPEVQPRTPAFLPAMQAADAPPTRLELARWIVDPVNPLTRRVAVNRIWQHLFGYGLVRTPEDFGLKGESPSHPALLDWLAEEFLAQGWSRKALIERIVTSATYRQASRIRPELVERDPENRLLGRQNRYLVEAELVRDLALAAAGLLNPELGGPSTQPPLPAGLAAMEALKNERFMEASAGAQRYRRGLYVNVQRTFIYPALKTFDVADPNVSCARRDASNTPLQALTLLNEPAFTECAQAMGRRILDEAPAARAVHAFKLALGRLPDATETAAIVRLLDQHRAFYRQHPEQAARFAGSVKDLDVAEVAAWVGVARTLLNLDEFITRE